MPAILRNSDQRLSRRFLGGKQKRLDRKAPVPCIVRTDGLAEEDSLAENIQRAPLHPLDQFSAFQAMRVERSGRPPFHRKWRIRPQ